MLRDGWVLILAATVLALAAGFGATLLQNPTYLAQARLFVVTPGASSPVAFASSRSSLLRVQTYVELAKSTQVLGRVADDVQGNESIATLTQQVTLTADPGSSLVTVSATNPTAEGARDVANAMARTLVQVSRELETASTTLVSQLQIIDAAPLPDSKVRGVLSANLVVAGVVGVLVSSIAIITLGVVRGSMRYRDEVGLVLKKEAASV